MEYVDTVDPLRHYPSIIKKIPSLPFVLDIVLKEKGNENTIKMTGETYLLLLTELREFNNNVYKFSDLFKEAKKNEAGGIVYKKEILKEYEYSDAIGKSILFSQIDAIRDYSRSIWTDVVKYLESLIGVRKDSTYTSRYIKIELSRQINMQLKKEKSEVEVYELKKYYCYSCSVYISDNGELIEKKFVDGPYSDLSFGNRKKIMHTMLDFSRIAQQLQDEIYISLKRYTVFALGTPENYADLENYGYYPDLFVYATNAPLTSTEAKLLSLSIKEYKEIDNIKYEINNRWNSQYNTEMEKKGYIMVGGEFPFYPLLNDKGMIANPELFYDLRKKEPEEEITFNQTLHDLQEGHVSRHFKWKETVETTKKSLQDIPNASQKSMITYAAQRLDQFRDFVGAPFQVLSWYRGKLLNTAVGGVPDSAHLYGLAIDIKVAGMSAAEVWKKIKSSSLEYDQLIVYKSFVHIGFKMYGMGERNEAFPNKGTPWPS